MTQTNRVYVARDLAADLAEQTGFLRASASAYDAGVEPEAKRLALTLRLLLYDTRNQRSLLSRMRVRDRIPLTDTSHGDPPPGTLTFTAGLATMRIQTGVGGSVTYVPYLDGGDPGRRQPAQAFVDWWAETVMRDATGNCFSRADLVLAVSNQDGGAHVDERLNAAYAELTRGNSLGFSTSIGEDGTTGGIGFGVGQPASGPPFDNSPALANVRQIAWELENSIDRQLVLDGDPPYLRAPICPLSVAEPPHVGRSDPCPCGSGRKLKHCFGRREPRRFRMHGSHPT
jgi:hypothetical protein